LHAPKRETDADGRQIIAAVLNRYYNFSNPNDLGYTYWYIGEVAISIFVGNIPLCWPLVRRVFRADTWSDSKETPEVRQPPRKPRRPPLHQLYSSFLLTTMRQTAWDKMDDVEASAPRTPAPGERETKDEDQRQTHSHGSEIELTPTWHHHAHATSVGATESGAGSGSDENDRGVVVVKTVHVSRGVIET
jgi:hypothetical protein